MGVLTMIGQVVLALAILITLHEMGHFWAARAFGIRVEKFYLFFDAWGLKLFSFKKGDTEYGIGWLPLGGYVKIAGMVDESLDKEQMNTPPQSWEFRSKPAWQRLIVMLGGVTVNAILGILIMSLSLVYYGDQYLPNANVKYGIHALPLGKKVGFLDGDNIVTVNGKSIDKFYEAKNPDAILQNGTQYVINRNGENLTLTLPDNFADLYTKLGKDSGFIEERMKFRLGNIGPNTPASKSDLRKGDYIITIDNKPITYFHEIRQSLKINTTQEFVILRGKDTLIKQISIGKELIVGFNPDLYEYESWAKTEHPSVIAAIKLLIINWLQIIGNSYIKMGVY